MSNQFTAHWRPLIIIQIIKSNNNMSLQEKPLTNAQLQKATSRRSRKDEEGRDFQCGCGKRYLSYPALYTHIKTKHDGRQPEGTQKTGTNPNIKRPKCRIEQQNLKNILSYMERQDLKLLSELDQFHLGKVSLHSRIKKQNVPKEIYQCYHQLIKDQQCKLTTKSSIDLVLTVYLLNVGNFVNQKLFEHFLLFVRIVRSCYLQSGEEAYRHCFSNPENSKQYITDFSNSQIRCFPIICDYFLRYYIGVCEVAKGYKQINLSLMQLMIHDLCAWLFRIKMTHIRVTLKKQYRLECKLVAMTNPISSDEKDLLKEKESQQQDQISNSQQIVEEDSPNQNNSIEGEEFQAAKEELENNKNPLQAVKNPQQIKLSP